MEDDSWSFAFSNTSSRSYQSALRSLSDLCIDLEEVDGDGNNNNYYYEEDEGEDDVRTEYPCPFCSEDFDLVDLCSHIDDDHPFEANPGICPVCATRVGTNMVRHITIHHGIIYKRLQKLKFQKDESYSTLSRLKKELQDGYFQSLLDVPSQLASSSKTEPDPLLSFLYNGTPADKAKSMQPDCLTNVSSEEKTSDAKIVERDVQQPPLTDKEQLEKGRRSQFVQGLMLSTIFDDDL
ncbi:protein DEHYDRATION-INDUCED 19 homolog 5-like [Mercurialis annua]|uniref:protein DEHYDRATION-INDUCED 19 homolog 5-like n=1 Tax=Mercurialis annua TaxID=3986 RepID=UPI00215E0612|nr:protein DEHYDRATION-INDUCED 19 homolog 5-like [Mercurialis annua]